MKRLFFLIFLIFFFYRLIFFTPLTYFMRDLEGQFHPWKEFTVDTLIKGDFPFWNPYNFTGIPFLGNIQTAIFYPFSVFFYIMGWQPGLKFFYFFSLFILGIGFLLIISKKKLTYFLFLIPIILFNSFQFSQNEFLSGLGTSIWLPFLILFLLKNNLLFLAVSFSFSFLGGQPQYIILQIILLLFFLNKKNYLTLPKAGILAIMLSLPQFIETLIFFKNSYWITYNLKEITQLSLNFKDFINLLNPFYKLKKPYFIYIYKTAFWIKTYYVGFTTFLLSLSGIYLLLKRKKIFIFLFLVFILLLSFGNNLSISKFFWQYLKIPLIRYPSRLLYVYMYIIIYLSLYTFSKIRRPFFQYLIIFLISIEFNFFIKKASFLEYPEIFNWKGKKISFLLKNTETFRLFLTPYTQEHRADFIPKERDNLFSNMNLLYRINNLTGQNVEPAEFYKVLSIIQHKPKIREALPLIKMFNVKYVISMFNLPEDIFKKIIPDSYNLYSIKEETFPRYFIVNRIKREKNVLEKINKIKKIDFYSDKIKEKSNLTLKYTKVKPVSFKNDRIKFLTTEKGYLIISENFYPNWNVFVNNKKQELLPVNISMRGVKLKDKKNVVFFRYIPEGFILSFIFLIILSCILLYKGSNYILLL